MADGGSTRLVDRLLSPSGPQRALILTNFVNRVGNGLAFGTSDNEAVVLGADGSRTALPRTAKAVLADAVWDLVVPRLSR